MCNHKTGDILYYYYKSKKMVQLVPLEQEEETEAEEEEEEEEMTPQDEAENTVQETDIIIETGGLTPNEDEKASTSSARVRRRRGDKVKKSAIRMEYSSASETDEEGLRGVPCGCRNPLCCIEHVRRGYAEMCNTVYQVCYCDAFRCCCIPTFPCLCTVLPL